MKQTSKGKKTAKAPVKGSAEGRTIGIDLGDKESSYCVLSAAGEVMEEGSVRNTKAALQKHFEALGRTRLALETGAQSGWISRQLESYGHEVIVAHARDLQNISRSDRRAWGTSLTYVLTLSEAGRLRTAVKWGRI